MKTDRSKNSSTAEPTTESYNEDTASSTTFTFAHYELPPGMAHQYQNVDIEEFRRYGRNSAGSNTDTTADSSSRSVCLADGAAEFIREQERLENERMEHERLHQGTRATMLNVVPEHQQFQEPVIPPAPKPVMPPAPKPVMPPVPKPSMPPAPKPVMPPAPKPVSLPVDPQPIRGKRPTFCLIFVVVVLLIVIVIGATITGLLMKPDDEPGSTPEPKPGPPPEPAPPFTITLTTMVYTSPNSLRYTDSHTWNVSNWIEEGVFHFLVYTYNDGEVGMFTDAESYDDVDLTEQWNIIVSAEGQEVTVKSTSINYLETPQFAEMIEAEQRCNKSWTYHFPLGEALWPEDVLVCDWGTVGTWFYKASYSTSLA